MTKQVENMVELEKAKEKAKEGAKNVFDAMKRIQELEKENEFLKRKVYLLRFELLPKEEQDGAMNAFYMRTNIMFGKEVDDFKIGYIKYLDRGGKVRFETLPF